MPDAGTRRSALDQARNYRATDRLIGLYVELSGEIIEHSQPDGGEVLNSEKLSLDYESF